MAMETARNFQQEHAGGFRAVGHVMAGAVMTINVVGAGSAMPDRNVENRVIPCIHDPRINQVAHSQEPIGPVKSSPKIQGPQVTLSPETLTNEPVMNARPCHANPEPALLPNNPMLPTPVKHKILDIYLQGYDEAKKAFILRGFRKGFSLCYEGEITNMRCRNLRSAMEQPHILEQNLSKEVQAGRIAGPFPAPPFPAFHVSPLGLVEKKESGKFRMIHHLSHPEGKSVNDHIPKHLTSVQYISIQDAIEVIVDLDCECYLAKADIAAAFRIVPVAPSNYPLLGIEWNGLFYYDRCLPMGSSISCSLFQTISTAVQWVAHKFLPEVHILTLLDDYLFISKDESSCRHGLQVFQNICRDIGVPLAGEKTMGPAKELIFLGITLDTVRKEAKLPPEKLSKCRREISAMLPCKHVTLRQLQSLLGVLSFACSVIVPGRAFLRRLFDLTVKVKKPHHRIKLTRETKEDLKLWLGFLEEYNGRSFFMGKTILSSPRLRLHTDSSGNIGYGALFRNHWFKGLWPDQWKDFNITVLEFFPIVLAVVVWGQHFANSKVEFVTDNAAVMSIINKQT